MNSNTPTVLFDIDGAVSLVSVHAAATARQAVRVMLAKEYDGAIGDYLVMVDINGDGSVYRPMLSEYRGLVGDMLREWHCPSAGVGEWEGSDMWTPCKAASLPGAVEFWVVPR